MTDVNDLLECVECGGRVARRMVTVPITMGSRAPVRVRRRLQRCEDCGEIYFAPGEGDEVYRAANDVIRARERLLSPDEVRAIRAEMGLSQAEFERLLRVGPKTVVRWERGTIFQNRATDTLLRAIRDVPQVREYLLAGLDVDVASEESDLWATLEFPIPPAGSRSTTFFGGAAPMMQSQSLDQSVPVLVGAGEKAA